MKRVIWESVYFPFAGMDTSMGENQEEQEGKV
jgi:hypothetical protein